jgi:photosystem II stability/assembly factor-like uncharacterized protein
VRLLTVSGDLVFCVLSDGSRDGSLVRSTDAGRSWDPVAGGLPPPGTDENGGRFGIVSAVAATGLTALAARYPDGIYRSDDGGQTWSRSDAGIRNPSAIVFELAIAGEIAFARTELGTYRSVDGGRSWLPTESAELGGFLFAPGAIFAAGSVNLSPGVFRSDDDGATWTQLSNLRAVALTITSSGALYALSFTEGVQRSADGGRTWEYAGLFPAEATGLVAVGNRVFVSDRYNGVFSIWAGQDSWTLVNDGFSVADTREFQFFALGLAVSAEYLFAATSGNGVQRLSLTLHPVPPDRPRPPTRVVEPRP